MIVTIVYHWHVDVPHMFFCHCFWGDGRHVGPTPRGRFEPHDCPNCMASLNQRKQAIRNTWKRESCFWDLLSYVETEDLASWLILLTIEWIWKTAFIGCIIYQLTFLSKMSRSKSHSAFVDNCNILHGFDWLPSVRIITKWLCNTFYVLWKSANEESMWFKRYIPVNSTLQCKMLTLIYFEYVKVRV